MSTIDLEHDIHIDVPSHRAWAVVADYARDHEWRAGVISMIPSPPGVVQAGTTTSEDLRLGGKTWHNDGEVTAVTSGRSFSWRTTSGADAHGGRSVEPIDERSCRVRLELHVRPHGVERLLAPMLRRMLDANLRGDLARLRTMIESECRADEREQPRGQTSSREPARR